MREPAPRSYRAPSTALVPAVELRGLVKTYDEGELSVPVLRGIDLCIEPGEFVSLRGPSGSGKSTLLNILGCLDRPTAGRYVLGGTDVSALTREEQAWVRLHHIGFVFQSFHLLPDATAAENVVLPLFYAGVRRAERERRARELLERVGLAHRFDHVPSRLSGGERQRVAIARALACRPRLLLADEPTGALDSRTGASILELLLDLHRRERLTIVLVTHDPGVAEAASRRIFMRDGRIEDDARA
ncbi:MAG: ABC transporter ATP-binding protein [Myxococcota bacterium]|nr:ABC transporter ATP-binding protein [Myxococcota bacterium]MDW8361878.1 ABC transporter ATP-binding protein [Myxococcales bacterium]